MPVKYGCHGYAKLPGVSYQIATRCILRKVTKFGVVCLDILRKLRSQRGHFLPTTPSGSLIRVNVLQIGIPRLLYQVLNSELLTGVKLLRNRTCSMEELSVLQLLTFHNSGTPYADFSVFSWAKFFPFVDANNLCK